MRNVPVSKNERNYMLELASKGYSQTEIGRMTGRSQSCVNYQISKRGRFKRCDYNKANYRIRKCGGLSMKFVVYKELDTLYMTNELNYHSTIRNASQITTLKDFDNFAEVVDYMCKYSNAIPEQFINRIGG